MFELMKLPYDEDALEPVISKETIGFHYGKHHAGYVKNLNKLVEGTQYEDMSLDEIINTAPGGPVFNNAAQVWNHDFYWKSLTPNNPDVGQVIPPELEETIKKYWSDVDTLKTEFKTKATKHFGSGWAWLCLHPDGSLFTQTSPDAETPIIDPLIVPLLVVDLWEHAYYLQYKNDRGEYIDQVWTLINWESVAANLGVSTAGIDESTPSQ